MKVKARYRRIDASPFSVSPGQERLALGFIRAEVPDGTSLKDLEEPARKAAPEGYELIEVVEGKD
jgi:hypothetical protein